MPMGMGKSSASAKSTCLLFNNLYKSLTKNSLILTKFNVFFSLIKFQTLILYP